MYHSRKEMWTGYRKTIFTTIIVVLVAFSFHLLNNEKHLDNVIFKFEEFVDEIWTKELHNIIKVRKYYTGWNIK